ncbi:TolC family protein [Sphingobacterium faecale]|uniref:TolC family protein n=1 Tax=Sphingobacterium faecale TaxID=2803775 RepID=A0ABS1R3V3_9SPHI|nr:TolC family protein [Sphingobacterium faecale]MBL1409386.1 TolC family protein [Sphingobacterium faecale]
MPSTSLNRQSNLSIEVKKEELKEFKNSRIPVFYIDANIQRNLVVPITPVPAVAFDPNALDGAVIPLKFATKWSAKTGLQMEWQLFDPKYRVEKKQKILEIESAALDQAKQEQEWKRDATLAYAGVVLASKQYRLALQDSIHYDEILKVLEIRYKEGREQLTNYLAAQQEFERKRIQLYESWTVLRDADLELCRFTDLETIKTLDSDINDILTFIEKYRKNNITEESLRIERRTYELQKEGVKRQLLPTFKLNAYLGEQYYSNVLHLDKGKEWYGSSYVNAAVKVPISTFFTYRSTYKRLHTEFDLVSLKIDSERFNEDINEKQREGKIAAARVKLKRLETIADLARQAKENQERIYKEGRLLVVDLNESIHQLNQTKREVWQAEYDLIQAILE